MMLKMFSVFISTEASVTFFFCVTFSHFLLYLKHLRQVGVVGKFVEFFGPGVAQLSIADRATIANMCPEYGATAAFFPVDSVSIQYLEQTGERQAIVRKKYNVPPLHTHIYSTCISTCIDISMSRQMEQIKCEEFVFIWGKKQRTCL